MPRAGHIGLEPDGPSAASDSQAKARAVVTDSATLAATATKKATVGTGAGQPVPRDAILAALREIDYTGEFAAEGSGEPTRRE